MFASTALNYMDRQAVAVVGDKITGEFRIRFEDLGWIIAAFQISYALFQVPAGFLVDRWNVRWTYAGAVIWWSAAAIAVAMAPTLGVLMACRAVLGLGESFNWPCALRVTSRVLPPADRSLGNGIFNSGAAVGAVVTPLVVTPLTLVYGWRVAFAAIGAVGFVWVAVWLIATGGERRAVFHIDRGVRPAGGATGRGLGLPALLAYGGLLAAAIGVVGLGQTWVGRASSVMPEPGLPAVQELLRQAGEVARERGEGGPGNVTLITGVDYRVQPGDTVGPNDVVATVSPGVGPAVEVKAGTAGVVRKLSTTDGSGGIPAGTPLVELETRPYRLASIWWGVALLMVGLLVVSAALPMRALDGSEWTRSLGEVVRLRRFWVLVAVSVTVNVCWHFLVNWLPTYLKTDRGMAFLAGSLLSAVPFLAADAGNLLGGDLSRRLARRGFTPARARLAVLSGCVFLISAGTMVGTVQNDALTIALLAVMALGTAAFMANYFAFCQEVSAPHTGLIVGILGGLGNLFAAGFSPIAGRIKDTTGSFGVVFVVVGLLPFIGLAALWLAWGRDRVAEKGAGVETV